MSPPIIEQSEEEKEEEAIPQLPPPQYEPILFSQIQQIKVILMVK